MQKGNIKDLLSNDMVFKRSRIGDHDTEAEGNKDKEKKIKKKKRKIYM